MRRPNAGWRRHCADRRPDPAPGSAPAAPGSARGRASPADRRGGRPPGGPCRARAAGPAERGRHVRGRWPRVAAGGWRGRLPPPRSTAGGVAGGWDWPAPRRRRAGRRAIPCRAGCPGCHVAAGRGPDAPAAGGRRSAPDGRPWRRSSAWCRYTAYGPARDGRPAAPPAGPAPGRRASCHAGRSARARCRGCDHRCVSRSGPDGCPAVARGRRAALRLCRRAALRVCRRAALRAGRRGVLRAARHAVPSATWTPRRRTCAPDPGRRPRATCRGRRLAMGRHFAMERWGRAKGLGCHVVSMMDRMAGGPNRPARGNVEVS